MEILYKVKRLTKQEFLRNVLTLMTGTTIAQLLPILVSPILTRIYSPSDFGSYALYISMISIISVAVTLRYEFAIVTPKKREDALNVLSLSLLVSFSISILMFIIVLLFHKNIISLIGNERIANWLYSMPLAAFLLGMIQIFNYWFNREKLFNVLSKSRIIQTFGNILPNIAIGLIYKNEFGLIFGHLLGATASVVYLFYNFTRTEGIIDEFRKNVSLSKIREQAIIYKEYPKFNTLSAFLDTMSLQLPALFVSKIYSSTNLGYYNLTIRTISTPLSVISTSVSQVFFQKISEAYNQNKPLRPIILKTAKYLSLVSIFTLILLLFCGPQLFAFVFGEKWFIAGEFARILGFSYVIKFVVSPLSVAFLAVGEVRRLFYLQAFRFICTVLVLFLCLNVDIIQFLLFYSLYEFFYYILYFILILRLETKNGRFL
ncbi:hypothetical protein C0966_12790 [Bacillus methanolicus]|uniref:oligosaccharide flippase family protein n=1 Tax=Bacillus methanolicus TaxID=1471 RepID=UPI002380ACE9|nr:oligosaccharide flippase family protein [Bacillus methanolicus]MDE3840218.1 hypothetical protein [Bacillus methanolicus]